MPDSTQKPRLTPKQILLVRNLLKGMSLTDAALASGYSENYPGQAGYQALEQIRAKMPELLAKHGLTGEVQNELLEELLGVVPHHQVIETKETETLQVATS